MECPRQITEYQTLEDAVSTGALPAAATGLSGIHKAAVSGALCARQGRKALFLAADEAEAQRIAADLSALGLRPLAYPARDFNLQDMESTSREYEHQRLQVLARMLKDASSTPDKGLNAAEGLGCRRHLHRRRPAICPTAGGAGEKRTVVLRAGQQVSPEQIIQALLACGYQRAVQIDGTGQFSLRGGILDIFTPDAPNPVRLEFWGDEIDTLSFFDLETQRRTDPVEEIILAPAMEALITDRVGWRNGCAAWQTHCAAKTPHPQRTRCANTPINWRTALPSTAPTNTSPALQPCCHTV